MKLSYDSLIALKTAFQMRLEFLEEEIGKAEKAKDEGALIFWVDRHDALTTAITELETIIK
jgi:hypothetical protein